MGEIAGYDILQFPSQLPGFCPQRQAVKVAFNGLRVVPQGGTNLDQLEGYSELIDLPPQGTAGLLDFLEIGTGFLIELDKVETS
jgi:2-keto-3-deoxy-6-phosphogluconate aldolase